MDKCLCAQNVCKAYKDNQVLSGLDLISADAVMRVLEQYHREFDCAFLLIAHDMDSAYRLSDTILTMQAGQIVRVGIKQ